MGDFWLISNNFLHLERAIFTQDRKLPPNFWARQRLEALVIVGVVGVDWVSLHHCLNIYLRQGIGHVVWCVFLNGTTLYRSVL